MQARTIAPKTPSTWSPPPLHFAVIVSFTTVTTGKSSSTVVVPPCGGDRLLVEQQVRFVQNKAVERKHSLGIEAMEHPSVV